MNKRSKRRPSKVEKQLRILRMRVRFLEHALKPAVKQPSEAERLNRSRERAEENARVDAMLQYYHQKKIEYYLRHPDVLATDLAHEREVADYLRERGITPEPSRIPAQFHRGLKKYQPTPKTTNRT